MCEILSIKEKFNEIISVRDSILNVIKKLHIKINELQEIHIELNLKNKNFTLGLDSLNFQNRLLDIEFENFQGLFKFINNRIYRDYYKFFRIVITYVKENITDPRILSSTSHMEYPIYKDLEPYKEYEFSFVSDIHYNITRIITELQNVLIEKEQELKNDEVKSELGLNIHNYINDEKHRNYLIKNKINLFVNYLRVFNNYHEKYLQRFNLKIKLLYGQIQTDIRIEHEYTQDEAILNEEEEKTMRSMIREKSSELDTIIGSISETTLSDGSELRMLVLRDEFETFSPRSCVCIEDSDSCDSEES